MLSSSDPDAAERFQWAYERAIDKYQNGGNEIELRADLHAIGYRGHVLDDEINYQKMLKSDSHKQNPPTEFVSGLPERDW